MSDILDASQDVTNPGGFHRLALADLIAFVLHHSVGPEMSEDATEEEERAVIRRINNQHVGQGYGGFGYHAAVFPSGRSYKTGSWLYSRAHVWGRNHEALGVVAIGTFHKKDWFISDQQQQGIINTFVEMRKVYPGRPVTTHQAFALPGHGTVCPGNLTKFDWDFLVKRASRTYVELETDMYVAGTPDKLADGSVNPRGHENYLVVGKNWYHIPTKDLRIELQKFIKAGGGEMSPELDNFFSKVVQVTKRDS